MTKTTKRTDAVAAAREQLEPWTFPNSVLAIDAFEAAIRAECGTREAALLRAIGRAINSILDGDNRFLGVLQRAQRRARTGAK